MNLLDLLAPECIKAPTAASDKRGVIDELVDCLATAGRVGGAGNVPVLKEAVWTREQTRTTGIGHGLAIPHGKCPGVPALAMAIGKPPVPIDFQALDGQPVRLVILLASPPDRPSDHIQALAKISKYMMMERFREQVYAAQSADEIYQMIREHEQR